MDSNTLAQTNVRHLDKWFFVSTINRRSSAILNPSIFAETIVWESDAKGNRKGIVAQGEDSESSVRTHLRIVEALFTTGEYTN